MRCLHCDSEDFKRQRLRFDPSIKGQNVEVVVPCYVCESCSTPLMDSAQMNVLRRAAADEYRSAHGLLTSEQIIRYRETLGMSQAAFARYLSVGEASIKRWETYHIQDASQDDHIRLKCDVAYAEVNYLNVNWKKQEPDVYSGHKRFSLELFKNVALYLVEKTGESLLFLNKLHFYVDFLHFKRHRVSITGTRYAPLKYGPCPDQYRMLYDSLECNLVLRADREDSAHSYRGLCETDLSLFDDKELQTLEDVATLCKERGAKALYELSHVEKGYVDTPECTFISYDFAEDLLL